MKRLLTICIVVTAVALIAAPAFAEVQNVKVSGDVNTNAVYRENLTLVAPLSAGTSTHDNYITTSVRVKVDADLTDNVSATVRYLTEYDWDTENNTGGTGDNVDLDLANVTLKEVFYGPLSVTVGRQELRYGNAFVIGDPDTNTISIEPDTAGDFTPRDLSLRKSFDAVKAVLDYDPLVVDVIYVKIDETSTTKTDEDLYGVNVAYDIGGEYDSEIEGYWFLNDNDLASSPFANNSIVGTLRSGNSIHTIGARGSMRATDSLNLSGELAFQRGDFDSEAIASGTAKRDQKAMAYQIAADYSFADIETPSWLLGLSLAEPVLRLGWTHYDGEEYNETNNLTDHEAWIPLYEDQSHGVVANWILGGVNGGQNSNADILTVGGSLSPIEDLTLSLDWYKFWLDQKLVSNDGQQASQNTGLGWTNLTEATYYMLADDDLGFELDLALDYDYTEDVKMGLSAGWFSPGQAFEGSNADAENAETALQVLATLDVAF